MIACSTCTDCRERTRTILRPRAQATARAVTVPGAPPVTRADLEKYLAKYANPEKFTTDQVRATIDAVNLAAAEAGLKFRATKPKKQRAGKTGPSRAERIKDMLADGHGVDYISEMENLSPSRARRLIAELAGEDNDD